MEGFGESPIGESDEWGIWSKDGRIKPSGRHDQKFLKKLFLATAEVIKNPSKLMVKKIRNKKPWN